MRATSDSATKPVLARLRFRFADLHSSKWRRPALVRRTLPLPVILNRLATAFLVLLRAIDFGMGGAVYLSFTLLQPKSSIKPSLSVPMDALLLTDGRLD